MWDKAVNEEHRKFLKYKVFKAIKHSDVPKDSKFISTPWAMKRKSNGVRRARLNMRGFEQEEGVHFYPTSTAVAPATNNVSIRMLFTIASLIAGWIGYIIDVKGAFLNLKMESKYTQKYLKNLSNFGIHQFMFGCYRKHLMD